MPFKSKRELSSLFINENQGIHSVLNSGPGRVLGTRNTLVNQLEIDCQLINSQIESYLMPSVIRTTVSLIP